MSSEKKPKKSPMMEQYLKIRAELPKNAILFFRLGDFYELFFDDAKVASKILGITLTQRGETPMAGIPHHASETYINKLLRAGKKVGICDQVEEAQPGKLVKRELSRVLTPGTTIEDSQINAHKNHYILALNIVKNQVHAAWLDLTTGGFAIASDPTPGNLLPVFNALDPKEVLVPEIAYKSWQGNEALASWWQQFSSFISARPLSPVQDYHFDPVGGAEAIMETLGVLNLEGFGVSRDHQALGPASALITYATENLCAKPKNIRSLKEYRPHETLLLDPATLRSLEIFKSSHDNSRKCTLIEAMDGTVTAAGARLLEHYLATPLLDLEEIHRRQQCVAEFVAEPSLSQHVQELLKRVRDITRILSRLQNRIRNPRELGGIRDTLNQLPEIIAALKQFNGITIKNMAMDIDPFDELRQLLARGLKDELPSKLQDGGIIKHGYHAELDHLLDLTRNNKEWLAELERTEQEKTGIKKLRVKYNGTFGYFIEVTKSNLHLIPEDYIRKQTMTNAERFITEDLKIKEKEILSAEDRALAKEESLFKDLVGRTIDEAQALLHTAEILAQADLFVGWAQLAIEWDYARPTLDDSDCLEIKQGRHPVVEQMLAKERLGLAGSHSFVPNDTWLKCNTDQIALITGPNMAGKSTYIRQIALITLMAQVGSWVPAGKCHIGIVDRIFSRVGASDELARGNSTFMVEMNETANIINNCSNRSLIILDEIGRGTSTYDGLSIAWAVIEHLHGPKEVGPRTLFATHYHELTKLENTMDRIRNYCVSVKEWNDQIIFVRQVVPGAADRSYGIHVARLAGLPDSVISRAKVILEELETEGNVLQQHLLKNKQNKTKGEGDRPKVKAKDESQLSFF